MREDVKLSPEERRDALVRVIRETCRAMNEAGYEPKWTPARLKDYVNGKYDVTDGLDALGFKEFEEVQAELSQRHDALLAERDGRRSLAPPRARHALERAAQTSEEAA